MMEAVRTSEMLVYLNKTTRRCIPESCVHTRRRENLKCHSLIFTLSCYRMLFHTASSNFFREVAFLPQGNNPSLDHTENVQNTLMLSWKKKNKKE
jgi:hypothetical protein